MAIKSKGPRPTKIIKDKKKRTQASLPKGFDSWFEVDMSKKKLRACEWKPEPVSYFIPHTYCPDAMFIDAFGKEILIELKGRHRFAKAAEMGKYKHIRDSLREDQELVFVLYEEGMRFPAAKKRKDGTFRTYEDWCESNGFSYYYPDTVPRSWAVKR